MLGERGWSGVFLIKDIKGRQADVGNFLIGEKDFLIRLCEVGRVLADASLIEAHAPPAIERDTPAKPNAGKAFLLRRLLFEERFDMAQFSRPGAH